MRKLLFLLLTIPAWSFGQATDLFFSEFAEGSANHKYIEIYNGTGAAVDLSNYSVSYSNNGCDVFGSFDTPNGITWTAGTMLANNDVYIIAHPSADPTILAVADMTSNALSNGDDVFGLIQGATGNTIIDIIGDLQGDPGNGWAVAGIANGTQNHTVVRKSSVCVGNPTELGSFGTDATDSEWIVNAQDDWSTLNMHTAVCAAGCNLTASGITALTCNDNATGAIPADDYLTFNLNPTGTTLGTNYNVTVSSGTVTPTTGTYNTATSFQLQAGSAGAGDVTLTITDDTDGGCTINQVITDPGVCSSATPVITLTPSTLTGFNHMVGTPSAEQTFTASGIALTADLVLTAPTGFEISTTTGTGFTSLINLTPVTGTVAATTIYVRGNAAAMGTIVGDITGTSTGATDKTVAVSGYADDYVYYTIDQVTTNDANGVADSVGVYVWLSGVTHCIDFDGNTGLSFTMIDGSNKGINVFNFNDVNDYVVTEGDSLMIRGQIAQFNGLTQITVDSIEILSVGAALQVPTIVTTLDETAESKVITIENLTFVTPITTFPAGSNNVNVTDGVNTFLMRIDSDTDIPGSAAPQVSFSVTGIGSQFDSSSPFDSGYQIFPCGIGSIVPSCTNPDVTTTIVGDTIYANATGLDYQWINCSTNTNIANEDGIYYVPTATGNYAVIVTDGECADTSACVNMTIDISGINETKFNSSIQMFPNPTNGLIIIQFEGTEATLFVTDLTGKLVEETKINPNDTVDLSNLNTGTYLVSIESNGEISTQRLIIK